MTHTWDTQKPMLNRAGMCVYVAPSVPREDSLLLFKCLWPFSLPASTSRLFAQTQTSLPQRPLWRLAPAFCC